MTGEPAVPAAPSSRVIATVSPLADMPVAALAMISTSALRNDGIVMMLGGVLLSGEHSPERKLSVVLK